MIRRAGALESRIPHKHGFGWDVCVYVGLKRFLGYKQRQEIQGQLEAEHGIAISTGEISRLEALFLGYLEALHQSRSGELAAALQSDGGWPMHVDATGEDGRGTLLTVFTGWRRWVLGAWKIPTEHADSIRPRLQEVVDRFGAPCAIMRDLGRAMRQATGALVAGLAQPVPVLSCHRHFLSDIGNDLLEAPHGELRGIFRCAKVRPGLRSLARDLGRKIGTRIDEARAGLERWQAALDGSHRLPEGTDGLGVVRGWAQWVLDYTTDSVYGSFPYDRPYLALYDRCRQACRAADAFYRHPPKDRTVRRALERFRTVLDAILDDPEAAKVVSTLRSRAVLFDELRDCLRLEDPSVRGGPSRKPGAKIPRAEEEAAGLHDIRKDIERLVTSLRKRRPARGPAKATRKAIDLVLEHVDRHGKSLWGHAIRLPQRAGGGIRLVARTNNDQENSFHTLKHGERRRSGRKILTQDFERLPAAAALAMNLRRPDYVSILCGSLEELPTTFARLDAQRRQACLTGNRAELTAQDATQGIVETASLPMADRCLVRSEAMNRRIQQAARSRAPHARRKAG